MAAVLGIAWVIGIFGLERDRISSFQLPLVLLAGVLVYVVISAIRRSASERRMRDPAPQLGAPSPCVTLRWYGEERSRREHPSGRVPSYVRMVPAEPAPAPRKIARSRPRLDYIPLPKA